VRRAAPLALLAALAVLGGCGGQSRHAPPVRHATPTATRRPVHRPPPLVLGRNPLRGAAARHAAVPVLLYHVIAPPPPGTPYPQLWVPPRQFAEQTGALRLAGYRGVTLERVLAAWRTGAPLPRHPIVVSFDDGYRSQYRAAFPTLRRLGWPGVLNLEVNDLGPGGIRTGEVRALLRAGWEVDSHTVTHPDLTTVGPARLRRELVGSRRILRRRFGPGVARLFCYPSGRYDATVEQAVRAAGYAAATTTQTGWATPAADPFALPRIRVDGGQSTPAVLAAVRLARPA
jgi:peptidoglycan/xylan/chitin deacetylase (PgdA/CDA1 family)